MKLFTLTLILTLLTTTFLFSQQLPQVPLSKGKNAPSKLKNAIKTAYQLEETIDFNILKIQEDKLGMKHTRFQQIYQGIPVEDAQFIVHEREGASPKHSGKVLQDIQVHTSARITKATALQAALNSTQAQKYAWEDASLEQVVKKTKNDNSATFAPKGHLVILPSSTQENIYYLAYKFDIFAIEPLSRAYIYVDAQTGLILEQRNRICTHKHSKPNSSCTTSTSFAPCTGQADYVSSMVNLDCNPSNNGFTLKDNSRGLNIETYNANHTNSYPQIEFYNATNHWTANSDAVAVHWGTQQVYDYYLEEHQRNSYDGNGRTILSWVNYRNQYNNALWVGSFAVYGSGDGINKGDWVSLDVIGHEITHGVTQQSADLIYWRESGALNESFSDIFGTALEFYAHPDGGDWLIAEDVSVVGTPIRSMENPKAYGDPDTYLGEHWVSGSFDNGGVHFNSGVQNHWFYLLSEGGEGQNDNGYDYNVTGIGIDKAADIAYRNLTHYLTPNATYEDAREGAIQAAIDLFGSGSVEYQQVVEAWCAVGVGDCGPSNSLTLTFPNGGEVLSTRQNYRITWTGNFEHNDRKMEYSLDNGATWERTLVWTAFGTYWSLPNINADNVLFKLSSLADPNIFDISDASFSIKDCITDASFRYLTNGLRGTFFSNNHYKNHYYYPDAYLSPIIYDFEWYQSLPSTVSYYWDFGDNNTSTEREPQHVFDTPGTYNVCLTVTNICETNTNCQQVEVGGTVPDLNQTFYKKLDYNSNSLSHLINLSTDELLLYGRSSGNSSFPFLTKINSTATVEWGTSFSLSGSSSNARNIQVNSLNEIFILNKPHNSSSLFLKLDELGQPVWAKTILSQDNFDINDFLIAPNEEILFWGNLKLLKTDANGHEIWQKSLDLNISTIANIKDVIVLNNGNYLLGGTFGAGNTDETEWFLCEINTNGGLVWSKIYTDYWKTHMLYLSQLSDGSIVVAKDYGFSLPFESQLSSVTKLSAMGNVVWQKQWYDISIKDMKIKEGNILLAGAKGQALRTNAFLGEIGSSDGTLVWAKTYGQVRGLSFDRESFYNVVPLADGSILAEGTYFVKTDTNGNTENCSNVFNTFLHSSSNSIFSVPLNPSIENLDEFTITTESPPANEDFDLAIEDVCIDESIVDFELPSPICQGGIYTFTNISTNSSHFIWTVDGQYTSDDWQLTHLFSEAGQYEIGLIVLYEQSWDFISKTITVSPNANTLNLQETYEATCEEGFISISSNLPQMRSYEWTQNEEVLGEEENFIATASGIYELTVHDSCRNSMTQEFTVLLGDECIYPGDLNYDGIVNHCDILNLGLAFGENGPARTDASIDWRAHLGLAWEATTMEGTNYKHIDANGDGTIGFSDFQAIEQNYLLSHDEAGGSGLNSDILSLQPIERDLTFNNDDTYSIIVDLALESETGGAATYGTAGTIYLDSPVGTIVYAEMQFENTLLSREDGDVITFTKVDDNFEKMDFSITRYNHQNVYGLGNIAQIFVVIDDILPTNDTVLSIINIDNTILNTSNGHALRPQNGNATIAFSPSSNSIKASIAVEDMVLIFPNPVSEQVNIQLLQTTDAVQQLQLYNILGQAIPIKQNFLDNKITLDASEWARGVYILRLELESGYVIQQEIVVQ